MGSNVTRSILTGALLMLAAGLLVAVGFLAHVVIEGNSDDAPRSPTTSGAADYTVVGKYTRSEQAPSGFGRPIDCDDDGPCMRTIYLVEVTINGVVGTLEVTLRCYQDAELGTTLSFECRS
jgi:hypothetical protein